MARGALVNETGLFAGEMRGDAMLAHFLYRLLAVIALVATQGDAMPARNLFYDRHCCLGFGASASPVMQLLTASHGDSPSAWFCRNVAEYRTLFGIRPAHPHP